MPLPQLFLSLSCGWAVSPREAVPTPSVATQHRFVCLLVCVLLVSDPVVAETVVRVSIPCRAPAAADLPQHRQGSVMAVRLNE